MMKAFKHTCRAAMALVMLLTLLALLSVSALAAGESGSAVDTVEVADDGAVTIVSSHAAGEMVSSVQVRISVSPSEGGAVSFTFDGGLADRLTHSSYRDGALNIYVAGAAPLMAGQDRLALGTISGADLSTVQLPDDALQFVYGRRVITQSAESVLVTAAPKEEPPAGGAEGEPEDKPEQTPPQSEPGVEPEQTPPQSEPGVEPEQTPPQSGPSGEALTALKALLEKARAIDPKGYTQTSYDELQTAVKAAETVLANAAASEADLTAASAALQRAYDRLVPVAAPDGSGPVIGDGPDDGTGSGEPEPGPGTGDGGEETGDLPTVTTAPAGDDDGPSVSPEFDPDADSTPSAAPTAVSTGTPAPSASGQPDDAPRTGDGSDAAAWTAMLCLCVLLLGATVRHIKKCR